MTRSERDGTRSHFQNNSLNDRRWPQERENIIIVRTMRGKYLYVNEERKMFVTNAFYLVSSASGLFLLSRKGETQSVFLFFSLLSLLRLFPRRGNCQWNFLRWESIKKQELFSLHDNKLPLRKLPPPFVFSVKSVICRRSQGNKFIKIAEISN